MGKSQCPIGQKPRQRWHEGEQSNNGKGRTENMNFMKDWYAENTNPEGIQGDLTEAIKRIERFLGGYRRRHG